jgi:hypothetical protein
MPKLCVSDSNECDSSQIRPERYSVTMLNPLLGAWTNENLLTWSTRVGEDHPTGDKLVYIISNCEKELENQGAKLIRQMLPMQIFVKLPGSELS